MGDDALDRRCQSAMFSAPETALQLERVLGIPTGFWIARERLYRESLDPNGEEQVFEGEEERPSIIWKLINKLAPDSKKSANGLPN